MMGAGFDILCRAFAAFLGVELDENGDAVGRVRHKARKEANARKKEEGGSESTWHSRSGWTAMDEYDPSTGQVGIKRKKKHKKHKKPKLKPPKKHKKRAYIFSTAGVRDAGRVPETTR